MNSPQKALKLQIRRGKRGKYNPAQPAVPGIYTLDWVPLPSGLETEGIVAMLVALFSASLMSWHSNSCATACSEHTPEKCKCRSEGT